MNFGRRLDGAAARLTAPRPILISLLVACAALAVPAPDAMSTGSASTGSNTAKPLWREYPLERTAAIDAAFAPPSAQSTARVSEKRASEPGRRTSWIVFLLTGVAVALTVATAVVLRRNSAANRSPAVFFDERTWRAAAATLRGRRYRRSTWPGPKPRRDRPRSAAVPERGASAGDRPPAEASRPSRAPAGTARALTGSADAPDSSTAGTEQTAAPPGAPSATEHSADTSNVIPAGPNAVMGTKDESAGDDNPTSAAPEAAPPPPEHSAAVPEATRAAPQPPPAPQRGTQADTESAPTATPARGAVRGPICQIRWRPAARGSCFSAVTTDASGVERTVATSPRVEWHRATPPEQNPEAQAALRQLSKTLRDKGWRPMRAKGKDFDEPQWYARRFRGPEAPAHGDSPGPTERGGSAP
jgi:hypothetical protein